MKIVVSMWIVLMMLSMGGMSYIGNEITTDNNAKIRADTTTPDDLKTDGVLMGCYSRCGQNKYGDIYCQIWLFKATDGLVYWIAQISVNSENGAVLDGGYSFLSPYNLINNAHTTSTLELDKPDNGEQSIECMTPMHKTSGGTAEKVTYTLGGSYCGGSASISWQVSYPVYCQSQTQRTSSVASWRFQDNQGEKGSNPTSATYTGGVAVFQNTGSTQDISIHDSMCSLTSSWWGICVYTHSYSQNSKVCMGYIS